MRLRNPSLKNQGQQHNKKTNHSQQYSRYYLYLPRAVTLQSTVFSTNSVFMGSRCFSQPLAMISINRINQLIFVMEQEYVLSEVGTELLYYSDEF
jgi:hypothetical protein